MQPQGHVQVLVQHDRLRHERAGGRRGARGWSTSARATPTGKPGDADGGTVQAEPGIPDGGGRRSWSSAATTSTRVQRNGGGYQGILIDPKTGMLHGGSGSAQGRGGGGVLR